MMKTCQDMLREVKAADRSLIDTPTFEGKVYGNDVLPALDRALEGYPSMIDNLLLSVAKARGVAIAALGAAKFAADHKTPESIEGDMTDPLERTLENEAFQLLQRCWVMLGGTAY
jgi:hypothetical protein